MRFISELYGHHEGEDIYIIGTGASLRVFPHAFLRDKVTIGLNMAWKVVPVKYCITIHPDLNIPEFMENEAPHPEITWICGKLGDNILKGITDREKLEYAKEAFYFFKYHGQPNTERNPNQPSTSGRILDWVRKPTGDYLYNWSSISQAGVNLAANMGAKNIVLVGCDNCSLLDNHHSHGQHTRWKGVDPHQRYQQYYEGLVEVRSALRERGVNLVSLTPFVSLAGVEKDFQFLCQELNQPKFINNPDISPVDSFAKLVMRKIRGLIVRLGKYLLGFRFSYIVATIKSRLIVFAFHKSRNSQEYDLIFVCPDRGWVIEGICKEINKYFYSDKTAFCYSLNNLPQSKAYFFSHYSYFPSALLNNPHILNSKNFVWYTHARNFGYSDSELIYALNHCDKVFATNSFNEKLLKSMGLKPHKVTVVLGGADEKLFTRRSPTLTARPCIGFCLAFQDHQHHRERKNFDSIVELIKLIDRADVTILGKNWHQYERFPEIQDLPYFRYVEVPYEQYPTYYHQMDVFVSVSKLEGGPIPLIEAMMCNVFPVVSNTGFAPDIITHGENGFIFEVDASVETIFGFIEQALKMNVDVRKTVEHLTWENFSLKIQKAMSSA